jgi:hypothetical protein
LGPGGESSEHKSKVFLSWEYILRVRFFPVGPTA